MAEADWLVGDLSLGTKTSRMLQLKDFVPIASRGVGLLSADQFLFRHKKAFTFSQILLCYTYP